MVNILSLGVVEEEEPSQRNGIILLCILFSFFSAFGSLFPLGIKTRLKSNLLSIRLIKLNHVLSPQHYQYRS